MTLESLADDYVKTYRYAEAISIYQDLLSRFSNQIAPSELQSVKDDYGVVNLLKNAPAQTIALAGSVRVTVVP